MHIMAPVHWVKFYKLFENVLGSIIISKGHDLHPD